MRNVCVFFLFLYLFDFSFSQHYTRTDTIPFYENGDTLRFPFAGGHNFVQFSDIDLNGDFVKDLFVFDRTGNKITTYLNGGAVGKIDYIHAPQYQSLFPPMQNWVLLADYNCDGKDDIFTSSVNPAGIRVYTNISATSLQFTLAKNFLEDNANVFIPANPIGIPAIDDVDGDGDLDILTFSPGSWEMSYYINKSKEFYGHCDSLVFHLDPDCWGNFMESGLSCSAVLSACRKKQPDKETTFFFENSQGVNGSSCSLCLDMDADGDKEILIGQGGCCHLTLLTNGGTPTSANMVSFTNTFPSGTSPVSIKYNPCAYFLDVNNDAKRDLLVAPSMPNISINDESIWLYQNIGTDHAPIFIRKTRSFLQEDMIDVGEAADPVFFDFDSDGLYDLLVSNHVLTRDSCPGSFAYGVHAYRNIGTPYSPAFQLVSTDYSNLSFIMPGITNKHLTFGDLDGDGDEDMIVGDVNGLLSYFENNAPIGNPANFILVKDSFPDNNGMHIDVGSNATPQLIDVDRDNDLDLIIGERMGNLNYYENIGTPTVPSFSLKSSSFGGVDVMTPCCTGFSAPFMYDSAGAGVAYHLLVGSEALQTAPFHNGLWFYRNIDNNLNGSFTLVDSMFQNIWEGPRMMVHGKDINSDGKMDLVIGNAGGGIAIYLGDTLTTAMNETANEKFIRIFPNPSSGIFTLESKSVQIKTIEVMNMLGCKVNLNGNDFSVKNEYDILLSHRFVIDLSSFDCGVYFVKLKTTFGLLSEKIVLVK